MKKILALIFSLFTLLLPFSGVAEAAPRTERRRTTPQAFCANLLNEAERAIATNPRNILALSRRECTE